MRAGPYKVDGAELENYVKRLSIQGNLPENETFNEKYLASVSKQLLKQKVFLKLAQNSHVIVPPSRLELKIAEMKESVEDNKFEAVLSAVGIDEKTFSNIILNELTAAEYVKEKVLSRIVIEDDELEKFYKENEDASLIPEKVWAKQILAASAEEAISLKRQIQQKKLTFEEAARRFSKSWEAARGGDLGWFAAYEMPAFFSETCFRLSQGVVSGPFESEFGWHLFLVVDKRPEVKLNFADAKSIIYKRLFERKKRDAEEKAFQKVVSGYLMEDQIALFVKNREQNLVTK